MANLLLKRNKDRAKSIRDFRTGDVIPVDGPSGTAKMSKDSLLQTTAGNALNIAYANYFSKYGDLVEIRRGYYSAPDADGNSTFTESLTGWYSLKFKAEKFTKYFFVSEDGYTTQNPKVLFIENSKYILKNDLTSLSENEFTILNTTADFIIIQIKAATPSPVIKFEKTDVFRHDFLGHEGNCIGSFTGGFWKENSGSIAEDKDVRYVKSIVQLEPFKTYKIKTTMSNLARCFLCTRGSTNILKTFFPGGGSPAVSEFEIVTQAYPMDLFYCCRVFTDSFVIQEAFVYEYSCQDEFKSLCDWVNTDSNMVAGWYDSELVLHDGSEDIKERWGKPSRFAHSTPIPVTAGQWEFKGQGVQKGNPIVIKSDANGVLSSDFMVKGLGLGNDTPYKHVFDIPLGVEYVVVVGNCSNGHPNSNLYLRKLSEVKIASPSEIVRGTVLVHTKDVRTITDNQMVDGVVNDNGNTALDYFVIKQPDPSKVVQGKRKIVIFFHGAGEPVNYNSWAGENFPMTNFFNACGYVVVASNGMPSSYAVANNLNYNRPVGNYMWIESSCRLVEKACKEYDCDPNEIYVYGESQGGMGALNFVECSGIKVRACVVDSPAISMLYSQLNISSALTNMLHFYGFNDDSGYSPDKVYGLDPFARNCDKIEDKNDYTLTGTWLSETELLKVKSHRTSKCPIKFFLGSNDSTTPAFASQIVYRQMKNAGQMVACNLYNGIGHCVDQNAPVIGTFTYRGNTYNVTQPIVDMVNWWARFGGYSELPTITPIS